MLPCFGQETQDQLLEHHLHLGQGLMWQLSWFAVRISLQQSLSKAESLAFCMSTAVALRLAEDMLQDLHSKQQITQQCQALLRTET